MSEEDIKQLSAVELKDFITENVLKIQSFEDAKRKYNKALSEMIKEVKVKNKLAMDVLEGKDSALARKVLIEVTSGIENR
jgi:phosphate uptake regulator